MAARLIEHRLGRVLLHMAALLGDREFAFHAAGIRRELWGTAS
jgi:hypothetical protein